MRYKLHVLLVLNLLLCSTSLTAEQATTDYRSPENFSAEEMQAMVAGMNDYGLCLRDEALKIMSKYQDVRQIADVAMTECQKVLDKLDGMMEENNYSPEFRKSYITHGRNRSAKVMLPEIMQMKASGY